MAPCNQEAVAWLDRWPQWGAPFVVIYGQAGCGKSHLAEVFRQATGAHMLNLQGSPDPYGIMGGAKVGVIENAEEILGTSKTEQALFHLYNYAKENDASILMTSRIPPAKWSIGLADLQSRMASIPVVEITAPDEALMEAILVKLFGDRQLQLERNVITYMLERMERSFASAQSLVKKIDHQALAQQRKITIPLVRDVLKE